MSWLVLAAMALMTAGGVRFVDRSRKDGQLSIGVVFGVLAIVADWAAMFADADFDVALSLLDAPVVAAALFFGPVAGVVAGAIATFETALTPLFGIDSASLSPLSTFLVALIAVAVRKWFLDGKRPYLVQSLMLGVVFEALHQSFDVFFSVQHMGRCCEVVFEAFLPESFGLALALALSSAFVGMTGELRSLWRSRATRMLAIYIGCCLIAVGSILYFAEYDSRRITEGSVRRLDHLFESHLDRFKEADADWIRWELKDPMFESDYNLVVSTNDWVVALANGGHESAEGKSIRELGVRPDRDHARLFGEWCHVGEKRIGEWCVYCMVPLVESYGESMIQTSLLTVLLFALVFGFRMVFLRLRKQRRKIDQLRAEMDEKRRQDMEMAAKIQQSCLPAEFPVDGRFAIAARMRPAREVGGDFYDCYALGDGRTVLTVADVSGKGVPAAMFMIKAKLVLKSSVFRNPDLASAVAEANRRLCRNNDAEMFVTAWIGIYDPSSGSVEFVNAGHNAPLARRAGGEVEWLRFRGGMALGMFEDNSYCIGRVLLGRGDSLLLYTDGVTEAQDVGGGFYGEGRLYGLLAGSGCGIVGGIFSDVEAFAGAAEQADDITVMALEVKP